MYSNFYSLAAVILCRWICNLLCVLNYRILPVYHKPDICWVAYISGGIVCVNIDVIFSVFFKCIACLCALKTECADLMLCLIYLSGRLVVNTYRSGSFYLNILDVLFILGSPSNFNLLIIIRCHLRCCHIWCRGIIHQWITCSLCDISTMITHGHLELVMSLHIFLLGIWYHICEYDCSILLIWYAQMLIWIDNFTINFYLHINIISCQTKSLCSSGNHYLVSRNIFTTLYLLSVGLCWDLSREIWFVHKYRYALGRFVSGMIIDRYLQRVLSTLHGIAHCDMSFACLIPVDLKCIGYCWVEQYCSRSALIYTWCCILPCHINLICAFRQRIVLLWTDLYLRGVWW